jgi:Ca-activated chloride channel family protein
MKNKTLRHAGALLAILVLGTLPQALPGQQQTGQAPKAAAKPVPPGFSDETYRVNVDLINVFCSVWDKDTGAFITNLTRDDFAVYEDEKKQEIKNFARETNLPLTIAFLIDTSQSVAPKLKFEQEAAISFFHSIMREKDRAALVEFDSGVTLVQDFTSDPNKMAKRIKTLRAAGGTSLYDAIYLTCDEKLIREMGRKAIVILSDGEDQSSNHTFEQALAIALKAEAIIYSISVNRGGFFGVGDTKNGDRIMKDFSEQTGGRAFFPFKIEDLDEAFRRINQELRSQYNIGYMSSNPAKDGSYRKIDLRVAEKGLRISYRKGYYAPGS